ncbi:hypothetical protein L208DRAFT_1316565, partial [Tricholoma matsutake]
SPQHLHAKELELTMLTALKPFTQYITYLAEGKLDGYSNSLQTEALVTDLEVCLPSPPILLLHDLGTYQDKEQIQSLLVPNTVHLFAVSGSGKTRLALEGLCHKWGFYFTWQDDWKPGAAGSHDFVQATRIMESMSQWNKSTGSQPDTTKNVKVAGRAFTMLICARVFVLSRFLKNLPSGTDAMVAQRRWVLAQLMPPSKFSSSDLFTFVLESLHDASTTDMNNIAGKEIFQQKQRFFAVVDEVQVAAESLTDYFHSRTTGLDKRPVLHAFYRFLWDIEIIEGVILSRTSLSKEMVQEAVHSRSAKNLGASPVPIVFVDVGQFMQDREDHKRYIDKYLSLSPSSVSDQRLIEQILYWFSGRYRFTASLIELLLFDQMRSLHRVLSAFAQALTKFTITDAIDLEEAELPLTAKMRMRVWWYGSISNMDRISKQSDGMWDNLMKCLFHVLMRWRIGSQAMSLPIEGYMHQTIALGVGHLEKIGDIQPFDQNTNYPVYLCEPLVVLYLSSFFAKQSWTTNQPWITDTFCMACNSSLLGFIYEEAVLLVLLQEFGGKARTLSDVFHCNQPWGLRKVTLVSLKPGNNGLMLCCPVSWTSGSSDQLGFRATSPTDVLNWFNNPNGKCFIFPDTHMGPNLLFFLQDEETKELILGAVQARIVQRLDTCAWLSALDSVMLQCFYTSNMENSRVPYAPSVHPGLLYDITGVLESILGSAEYKPVFDEYQKKLHSSKALDQQFASQPPRKTPKHLRIIATKEAHQRWTSECKGDVGVL